MRINNKTKEHTKNSLFSSFRSKITSIDRVDKPIIAKMSLLVNFIRVIKDIPESNTNNARITFQLKGIVEKLKRLMSSNVVVVAPRMSEV
ncbi:MAG: hypothetical protein COA33_002205 [Fluviicola sp.]|nr:hypothetical protein [Fluviicola sp.]